jgi:Flp pilus assembly protein CpaB
MPSVLRVLNAIRRRVLIHRRGVVAVCVAVLVWSVISTLQPPPPATETAWAAAEDLPNGTRLTSEDLVRRSFPTGTAPAAAHDLKALVGRTLAAPLGKGQVATVTQTMGPGLLEGYPGMSAVPIRIPDSDTVHLLRPGDRIDLVGSDPQSDAVGTRVVEGAVVLTLPRSLEHGSAPALTGRLVVLAVPSDEVVAVASAGSRLFLTVIWNR